MDAPQPPNVYTELTSTPTMTEEYPNFASYTVDASEDFPIEYVFAPNYDLSNNNHFEVGVQVGNVDLSWVNNGYESCPTTSTEIVDSGNYGAIGSEINNIINIPSQLNDLIFATSEIEANGTIGGEINNFCEFQSENQVNYQMWNGADNLAFVVKKIVNSTDDPQIPQIPVPVKIHEVTIQNSQIESKVSSNIPQATNKNTKKVGTPATVAKNVFFQCSNCEYVGKKKLNLKLHIISKHTKPENIEWFKCLHCQYKCKRKDKLKVHMINMHTPPDEIKWFDCTICEYKHKIKDEIKRHMKKKHNYVTPKEERVARATRTKKAGSKSQKGATSHQFSDPVSSNFRNHLNIEDIEPTSSTSGDTSETGNSLPVQSIGSVTASTSFDKQLFQSLGASTMLVTNGHNVSDDQLNLNEFSVPALLNESSLSSQFVQSDGLILVESSDLRNRNESVSSWDSFNVQYIERGDENIVESGNALGVPSSDTYSVHAIPELYENLILVDSGTSVQSRITPQYEQQIVGNANFLIVGDQNNVQYEGRVGVRNQQIVQPKCPTTVQTSDIYTVQSKTKQLSESRGSKTVKNSRLKQSKQYQCAFCPSFNSKYIDKYRSHMAIAHASPENIVWFECDICPFKTKFRDNVRQHKICMHGSSAVVQKFNCSVCKYKTRSSRLLQRHEMKHFAPKPPKMLNCPECTYKTSFLTTLKNHVTVRHSKVQKSFQCNKCDFKTTTAHYLKVHVNRKHVVRKIETRRFTCSFCKLKFRRNDNLKSHIKQLHSEQLEWFKCTLCSFKTIYKAALKSHIAVVHSDQIVWFKCGSCSFKSKYRSTFERHLAIHNKQVELLKCDYCSYETKRKWSLTRHVNTQHLESVEGFECELCDFKTKQKANLKVHVKRHDGEILQRLWFRCAVCTYKTLTKTLYERHTAIQHPNSQTVQQFGCKQCGFQAKSEAGLRAHVRRIHKNDKVSSKLDN